MQGACRQTKEGWWAALHMGMHAAWTAMVGGALRTPCVAAPVGQQHGRAADAENAAGDAHAALLAQVNILRDVFGGHHQRRRVGVHLDKRTGAQAKAVLQ